MKDSSATLVDAPRLAPPSPPRASAWAGYAACAWAMGYGGLWLYWLSGGQVGFSHCSALEFYNSLPCTLRAPHSAGGAAIVLLCALGAVLALATVRPWGARLPRWLPVTTGWLAACWLLLIAPQTLMLDMLRIVHVIALPVDRVGTFDRALPFIGGLLVAAATLAYQRRTQPDQANRTAIDIRPRWARASGYIAAITPVWYLAMHLAWDLDIRLGTTTDILAPIRADRVTFALQAAISTCLEIAPIVLALALIEPWGERFPRWVPLLARRHVPRWLLLAPALVFAVALCPYGGNATATLIRSLLGGEALPAATTGVALWIDNVTYLSFAVWGVSLGLTAIYHYQRRKSRASSLAHAKAT